ncbi:spore germination protein [Cohnella sp. GCM10027633]|uniref:spore germination protein n=1 Tax=unclassified Cohnella TaxID=2636738 RepID=UPI0036253E17
MRNERQNAKEEELRELFQGCADVKFQRVALVGDGEAGDWNALLVYCEGLADDKRIDQAVLPQLDRLTAAQVAAGQIGNLAFELVPGDKQSVVDAVFAGKLLLLFDRDPQLRSLDIADTPQRKPEESNTEVSVKGPRDGFTEQLATNVALIRKRLRTESLHCERFVVGRRSRTQVALLYVDDIINPDIVAKARQRIVGIDVDAIVGSEELAESISDAPYRVFPSLDYSGRPDFAVEALMRGRFIVVVDGTPMVLLAPTTLTSLLKTPEDIHASYLYVAVESLLRFTGLFVGILLPGFFIALISFQLDQIPFTTIATIINVRKGIPIPAPLEAFVMQVFFEMFREAGIRLPKGVGQTVTVVGGLFIGQAAIDAGLTSPAMLVVTALSTVSTYTLVNQSLSGLVMLLRMFVLACASFLGMYGFFLGVFGILLYLSRLESFGVPYLAPLSPPVLKDMLMALLTKPRTLVRERPSIYATKDKGRKEDGK